MEGVGVDVSEVLNSAGGVYYNVKTRHIVLFTFAWASFLVAGKYFFETGLGQYHATSSKQLSRLCKVIFLVTFVAACNLLLLMTFEILDLLHPTLRQLSWTSSLGILCILLNLLIPAVFATSVFNSLLGIRRTKAFGLGLACVLLFQTLTWVLGEVLAYFKVSPFAATYTRASFLPFLYAQLLLLDLHTSIAHIALGGTATAAIIAGFSTVSFPLEQLMVLRGIDHSVLLQRERGLTQVLLLIASKKRELLLFERRPGVSSSSSHVSNRHGSKDADGHQALVGGTERRASKSVDAWETTVLLPAMSQSATASRLHHRPTGPIHSSHMATSAASTDRKQSFSSSSNRPQTLPQQILTGLAMAREAALTRLLHCRKWLAAVPFPGSSSSIGVGVGGGSSAAPYPLSLSATFGAGRRTRLFSFGVYDHPPMAFGASLPKNKSEIFAPDVVVSGSGGSGGGGGASSGSGLTSSGLGSPTSPGKLSAPASGVAEFDPDADYSVASLEQLSEDIYLDIVSLKELQAQSDYAQTPMGQVLRFTGYTLSVVAILRLVVGLWHVAGFVLGDAFQGVSSQPDMVVATLSLFVVYAHADIDVVAWSPLLNCLLVASLALMQIRAFLGTTQQLARLGFLSTSTEHYALTLAFLAGNYFVASVVLLRTQLPLRYRRGVTIALGDDFQFEFFFWLFEFLFVFSSLFAAFFLWWEQQQKQSLTSLGPQRTKRSDE